MTALIRATLLLFRTHFTRVLWTKRTAFCALLCTGLSGVAFLVLELDGNPPPAFEIVMFLGWVQLQIAVPLVALIAGSAVIADEIDDRTITYLFTRPFPRASLLLGRWLATATILALLLGGGTLLLAVVSKLAAPTPTSAEFPVGIVSPLVVAAAIGGAVYSALFAALGTFLKRPMIVGLGYVFVIEGLLANVPGKSQSLTILYHLRSYVVDSSHYWTRVYPDELVEYGPPGESLTTLLVVLAVALAIGSAIVSRRQYVMTS